MVFTLNYFGKHITVMIIEILLSLISFKFKGKKIVLIAAVNGLGTCICDLDFERQEM